MINAKFPFGCPYTDACVKKKKMKRKSSQSGGSGKRAKVSLDEQSKEKKLIIVLGWRVPLET